MENKKTFTELLNDLPLAAAEDITNVTGVVARSADKDKFVLLTANGGRVTLPVGAVVDYQQIGGSIGQEIVQVQLKTDLLPAEERATLATAQVGAYTGVAPFVLATPHHVSADTLAAMQSMSGSSVFLVGTHFGNDKTPRQDGTYPVGNGRWHLDY